MCKKTYFYLKITEVHENGEKTSSEFSGNGPWEISTGAEDVEGKYVAVVRFKGTIKDVHHVIVVASPQSQEPEPDPDSEDPLDLLNDYNPSPAAALLGVMKFNIDDDDDDGDGDEDSWEQAEYEGTFDPFDNIYKGDPADHDHE